MATIDVYETAYKKLNTAQKEAVDTIDGPVMVIAGPGTGKTQVLAIRIATILEKTDTPATGILCLTFTNAGVSAMRERLVRYIGTRAGEVTVTTFHSFAISLIEKHYALLDFEEKPELLDETAAVILIDEILEKGVWNHIRPRGNSAKYFGDLKSLISLMKRESISAEGFLQEIEVEIKTLRTSPESISSRGARKGELKKEVEKQIEGLERTKEVIEFYTAYESLKRERGFADYDDVLAYAVKLVKISEDVRATLRENYLYVLVDEHQDSSGVQNAFIEAVWGDVEKPNIFVVGDDRQLIYGFGGASIEYFEKFRTTFGKAREITLVENYRSTKSILNLAESLLLSSLADGKLKSQKSNEGERVTLYTCDYPRDEIILAAKHIKEKIAEGLVPEACAILVPKNHQVRSTVALLESQGVPAAASSGSSFFEADETKTILNILRVIADPYDSVALGALLFDPIFEIPPLTVHRFLRETNMYQLSIDSLLQTGNKQDLFNETNPIVTLGKKIAVWIDQSVKVDLHGLLQIIGDDLFLSTSTDHTVLIRRVEVIRTFLHLVLREMEHTKNFTIIGFLQYLDRLEGYGHILPLAVFSGARGVRVLTLHGSKGLEFDFVHIAHLDESSLMRGKHTGFTLPERIGSLIVAKDVATAKRELYVAITRARKFLSLSYPCRSYAGAVLQSATILDELPETVLERYDATMTEIELLTDDPKHYIGSVAHNTPVTTKKELASIVKEEYTKTNVSVSLLNNFFDCPWRWYFRNILKLPEAKTESLIFGSAVHKGIELSLKGELSEKTIDAILQKVIAGEHIRDQVMITRLVREAKKVLALWQKEYLKDVVSDHIPERSVSYRDPKFPHLSMYGKVDLTERLAAGDVRVTDFKTGSSHSKREIEKCDDAGRLSDLMRQLAMYSYLIEGAEKGTVVSESRLLFIEKNPKDADTFYITKIGNENIDLLRRDIVDYDVSVSSGEWINRPCNFKAYGKEKECVYCALAKKLFS